MVFEDFKRPSSEDANANINTKLFECAYAAAPLENKAAAEDRAKDAPQQPKETHEQRIDNKIKERFGADVLDHLKDRDWLVEHRKTLENGFKKADSNDSWDMAKRMRELSMVDGKPLIYLSKHDGPTHGSLVPKRYDIMIRRSSVRSDICVGQLHH